MEDKTQTFFMGEKLDGLYNSPTTTPINNIGMTNYPTSKTAKLLKISSF
jgi:hypothetical protein